MNQNSTWRIQNAAQNFEKLSDYTENLYMKVYRVADNDSDFGFVRFNMADLSWRQTIEKIIEFCCEFVYTRAKKLVLK